MIDRTCPDQPTSRRGGGLRGSVRLALPGLLLLPLVLGTAPTAFAAPEVAAVVELRGPAADDAPFGRGPEDRSRAADAPGQLRGQPPVGPSRLPGKPRNDVIADIPVNTADASIPLNLAPYHAVPARLRALQATGRVAVEVIGQTVQGRPMYLAVATAPGMSDADWAQWQRLSDLRTEDPAAAIAAQQRGEYASWRSPLLVNNNIHGNEWEGMDGSLKTLDRLATSNDPEVLKLLSQHLLVFVVSNNPDGRVNGTRANANGFDMNRDYITASQPEVLAVRPHLIRYGALTMLDQHGYVACTLIEPTTGPHGENYEYDLFIRNAIRNGLGMEQAVLALNESRVTDVPGNPAACRTNGQRRADIPWRDRLSGWDDWPPVFTPQYAAFHGSISHTIEFPLNPRGLSNVVDRHDRTRINTKVVEATNWANFTWANTNRTTLLADQLEVYRRGAAGEGARPITDPLALSLARKGTFQGYDVDNAETFSDQTYPRAYVIPAGRGQRSETAAARLAQFLVDNDVRVQRATRQLTVGGQSYAPGSYVVDMHQAKRGLANTILSRGRDVTSTFPTMYDISAWSHADLWGATVDRVASGALTGGSLQRIAAARPTGDLVPGRRPLYGLTVDSVAGVQAVNDLARKGVAVTRLPDGRFVVPGSAYDAVVAAAATHGVSFTNLTPAENRGGVPVRQLRVGTSAPADEVFALTKLGFTLTSVSQDGFNAGTYTFSDFDALYVSASTFNPQSLNAAQQAAFTAWLAAGGTVVGRGGNGATFNSRAALLPVTAVAGRSDANGIVRVVNDPASPVTGAALPTSFVSSPRVFDVPAGAAVRVDQRLADGAFFLAGHWRDSAPFAGRPIVVSGTARGADVTLFGTEPLYRAHPEGLHLQVAEALWQDLR